MGPPGGDRFLSDLFYSADIKFLLGRLPGTNETSRGNLSVPAVKND